MNPRFFSLLMAAAILSLLPSCVEPPPGSESSIWQRPPRYGAGGTDSPKPRPNNTSGGQNPVVVEDEGVGGGRFGYTGDDNPAELEDPAGPREVSPLDPSNTTDSPTVEPPAEKPSAGPPSVSEMPFAKGVPGKPLEVTLPSPYDKLGPVSIEQFEGGKPTGKPLPPGTPVAIPDPGNPGKKIYFKVP